MVLAYPYFLLLLLLAPIPWIWLRRKGMLGHSNVRAALGLSGSTFLHRLPLVLLTIAFTFMTVALARPQRLHVESEQTIKARDIMVAVDISGSMGSPFPGEIPKIEKNPEIDKDIPPRPPKKPRPGERPEVKGGRRIDAAQYAVMMFIRDRYLANAGDRVGILVFDFAPYYSWPLTHDLRQIYRKGEFVDEGLGGGTNFGEHKPGPIDGAAEHFDELGKAVTKVLILVTDGEDNLSGSAKSRLADILNSRGISLYVVHVGDPDKQDLDILTFTQEMGGKVFRATNTDDLRECFRTIDQMERTVIAVQTSNRAEDVFYFFAFAGVIFLVLGVFAEALILSQ